MQFHTLVFPAYFNMKVFLCYELLANHQHDPSNAHPHPKIRALIILALQMRKLRQKKSKYLAQRRGEAQLSGFTAHAINRVCICITVSSASPGAHLLFCLPSIPALLQFLPGTGTPYPQFQLCAAGGW